MKPDRQQRLVRVDDGRDVDRPAGQEAGEELGEPEHQTGGADDEVAPEDREVVEFLPVGESTIVGRVPRPRNHRVLCQNCVMSLRLNIKRVRSEDESEPAVAGRPFDLDEIHQVVREEGQQCDAGEAVERAHRGVAAEDPRHHVRPAHERELERHSRQRQGEEAQNHDEVHDPLLRGEADVEPLLLVAVLLDGSQTCCVRHKRKSHSIVWIKKKVSVPTSRMVMPQNA